MDEAREVGERGRADVRRLLSVEAVGQLMKERLVALSAQSDPVAAPPSLLN
jgi:hypothetical protein